MSHQEKHSKARWYCSVFRNKKFAFNDDGQLPKQTKLSLVFVWKLVKSPGIYNGETWDTECVYKISILHARFFRFSNLQRVKSVIVVGSALRDWFFKKKRKKTHCLVFK